MALISFSVCAIMAAARVHAISTAWQPSLPHPPTGVLQDYDSSPPQSLYEFEGSPILNEEQDKCTLYKVAMRQQLYFEVFKAICFVNRFTRRLPRGH